MIRLCSGFPPDWPEQHRDRFLAGVAQHWPASIELVADELSQGGDLDRHRLIVPAAAADDMEDGDLIAWLDPDIETLSAVPTYLVPQLIKSADVCFITRSSAAADLGFWAARLSQSTRAFLVALAFDAASGAPAAETWTAAIARFDLVERDLTPGKAGDNWQFGPLGRYTRRIHRPE